MRIIQPLLDSLQPTRRVSGPAVIPPQSAAENAGAEFSSMMEAILTPNRSNQVSEEALFAALTVERVKSLKGTDAATRFQNLLQSTEGAMSVGSYIPYEDSARLALRNFRDNGELTAEEADRVHSEAFGAAQLDDNHSALYDDIGGGGSDLTFAALDITEAISIAKSTLDKFASGELSASHRALNDGFGPDGRPLVNPFENGGIPSEGGGDTAAPEANAQTQGARLVPGELVNSFISGSSQESSATHLLLQSSMGRIVEDGYGTTLSKRSGPTSPRTLQRA